MAKRKKPPSAFSDELIDKLLEGREHGAHLLGSDGLVGELKKRLAERMLETEMDVHLDDPEQQGTGNHRNGHSPKTVTMDDDRVVLDIPRDRHGQFDPTLIPKYARRFPGVFRRQSAALRIDEIKTARRSTGSPEAVTRLRLPQNAACGFPALRSSEVGLQHS